MNIAVNILFQAAAFIAQFANLEIGFVPDKYKYIVTFAITIAQAVIALKAHLVNPDGTSAVVAYKPEDK